MTIELLRAFLAGAVVVLVPGYPWSRVLHAALTLPERIAMSAALSLASVPAWAVFLAWLFGSGVTLIVAISSVLIVTLSGVAAYAYLGPPDRVNIWVELPGISLGPAALVPLLLATALMILSVTGLLPVPSVVLWISLLLILTAAVQGVVGRIRCSGSAPPVADGVGPAPCLGPSDNPVASKMPSGNLSARTRVRRRLPQGVLLQGLLLAGILGLVLVRGYSGPVFHDWPYIRGQDQYAHTVMINLVLTKGSAESFLVYPPGFHYLAAVLVRLSGLEPLNLFPLLAPALLLLPTIACYALAGRLFGRVAGLAAAFLSGAVLNSAYLFVYDGTYVDLIAAQFQLVLTVLALMLLLNAPTARNVTLTAVLGSSVILYHSVASIYLALMLLPISLFLLPYLLLRERSKGVALLIALTLMTGVSVVYAWDTYNLPETVAVLLGEGEQTDTLGHASIAIGTQQPRNATLYLAHISQPVGFFGLLGAVLLAVVLVRSHPVGSLSIALLLGWGLIFFVASRTSLSAFPIRFTRDLGIPLCITGACALVALLHSVRRRELLSVAVTGAAGLVLLVVSGQNLARASSTIIVQFMTPGIEEAGEWLRAHNTGGNIIVSSHHNQVPGNAMLAMGGYSELPAYAPWQLRAQRQIPPRDRRAVGDSLSVLQYPGGRRTMTRILPGYDVRYVVLYKSLRKGSYWYGQDPVKWRRFLQLPRIYERVFENDNVIIFKVHTVERG